MLLDHVPTCLSFVNFWIWPEVLSLAISFAFFWNVKHICGDMLRNISLPTTTLEQHPDVLDVPSIVPVFVFF